MELASKQNPSALVFLAPMAGATDLPFRSLVSRFGPVRVVSEMIASQDVLSQRAGTRQRAELGLRVENTAVQLAGREPHLLAEAARMCEANGARVIDINMGCPAKRVTSASGTGACGSALMREPDHALRLIDAVVGAVSVPVTLKTRLGWDHAILNASEIARRAEAAGVAMITIHGRTRCQFYNGHADWSAIADVRNAVSIPVIANGDITNVQTARVALKQSGADGVMIGRGARGRPWLPACVAADLSNEKPPEIPRAGDLASLVQAHYEDMLCFYGRDLGRRVARKHLGWYMDGAKTPTTLRRRILTETVPKNVHRLLPEAMELHDDALLSDVAA